MSDMTVQAIIWIGSGSLLVFYLKRRRKRKTIPIGCTVSMAEAEHFSGSFSKHRIPMAVGGTEMAAPGLNPPPSPFSLSQAQRCSNRAELHARLSLGSRTIRDLMAAGHQPVR